jgi:hypothetical protein
MAVSAASRGSRIGIWDGKGQGKITGQADGGRVATVATAAAVGGRIERIFGSAPRRLMLNRSSGLYCLQRA